MEVILRDPFIKMGKWMLYVIQKKRLVKLKFAVWSQKPKDEVS